MEDTSCISLVLDMYIEEYVELIGLWKKHKEKCMELNEYFCHTYFTHPLSKTTLKWGGR